MKNRFLLTSALILGAWSTPAFAQSQESSCAGMQPISAYTQKVLDHSADIIAKAKNEQGSSNFFSLLGGLSDDWRDKIAAGFLQLVDTDLSVVKEQRRLLENTACLHMDLCLIEEEIRKVHQELLSAHAKGSVAAITYLQPLSVFLNNRFEALLVGAVNPEYKDTDTGLCPFHSDYLPVQQSGYGCDLTVLERYQSTEYKALKAEYEAIQQLVDDKKEFVGDTAYMNEIQQILGTVTGEEGAVSSPGAAPTTTHKVFEGCLEDAQGAQRAEVEGLAYAGFRELRGPFSVEKDDFRIILNLLALRAQWAKIRQWPVYLQYSYEQALDEGQPPDPDLLQEMSLEDFIRQYHREIYFPQWISAQAAREALMVAKSQDAQLQTAEALSPVRSPMKELALLTFGKALNAGENVELRGIRGYVRNFAFFLRRSCMFRTCNERLDRIEKTIFEDDCFPYTTGKYLEDEEIHEKCLEAAEG